MQLEPIITFRGFPSSEALEAAVRARIRSLETYCRTIIGCRVLVEFGERHHRSGNRYHVRIELTVPGENIVVTHEPTLHGAAKDIELVRVKKESETDPARKHAHVAVREAFDVARRRLQDYTRRQSGVVKTPSRRPQGTIARVFPVDEYGYIEAADGHEVYFQKRSVLGGAFEHLEVGSPVSFAEVAGDKGPQASTVRLLHPRRIRRATGVPVTARAAVR